MIWQLSGGWENLCVRVCACNLCEYVCLIEGLADKLKSLLQMLSILSVCNSVSFHLGQEWEKKNMNRDGRMWAYMYAHLQSFHPLFPYVLLHLVTAAYAYSFLPLCFSYMCMLCFVCMCTCAPASLKCQSEGRGALILVLKGWGGRRVMLILYLWLESMLITRNKER